MKTDIHLINLLSRDSGGRSCFTFINPNEVAAVVTPILESENHLAIIILKSGHQITVNGPVNHVVDTLML